MIGMIIGFILFIGVCSLPAIGLIALDKRENKNK